MKKYPISGALTFYQLSSRMQALIKRAYIGHLCTLCAGTTMCFIGGKGHFIVHYRLAASVTAGWVSGTRKAEQNKHSLSLLIYLRSLNSCCVLIRRRDAGKQRHLLGGAGFCDQIFAPLQYVWEGNRSRCTSFEGPGDFERQPFLRAISAAKAVFCFETLFNWVDLNGLASTECSIQPKQ